MNARLATLALSLLGSWCAAAQNVGVEPKPDPVLDALQEFNERDKDKPNEVSVVLDPVGTAPDNPVESAEPPASVVAADKPPDETDHAEETAPREAVVVSPDEATPAPTDGLAVRVERLQTGKGAIDPALVKMFAPFPAKPLAQPPAGWHLDAANSATPFTREVEIAPGTTITLTIRPHLLVPDADGANVFSVPEPGYDTTLGYAQTATVGAVLSNSLQQLDEDSKQLGAAIDRLQQLLVSLPKPEPQPEVKTSNIRKK